MEANRIGFENEGIIKRGVYSDLRVGNEQGCRVCVARLSDDAIIRARVMTGSYDKCVDYIKTHRPGRGRVFGIIYNNTGRMASFCG